VNRGGWKTSGVPTILGFESVMPGLVCRPASGLQSQA
jgi:hypothetical protein